MIYEVFNRRDKKKFYKQCLLSSGDSRVTTWVEKSMAKPGKQVLVNDNGVWEVEEVYEICVSGEFLDVLENQNKHCRKETDI